jgi:hypothetical protein
MSSADQKAGYAGERQHFWSKDLSSKAQNDDIKHDDLRVIVDVDYYLDMNVELLRGNPTLIYTIEPTSPTGKLENSRYWYEDGHFNMILAGGATFRHKLWNYNHDTFSVEAPTFSIKYHKGIPYPSFTAKRISYVVERRTVSPGRALIFLIPIASHSGFSAYVSKWFLEDNTLSHLDPRENGYNVISTLHPDGSQSVSVAPDGNNVSFTLPIETDSLLRTIAINSKGCSSGLRNSQVKSHIAPCENHGLVSQMATSYYSTLMAKQPRVIMFPFISKNEGILRYQYTSTEFDTAAKPGLTSYMQAFLGPAPAPDDCKDNTAQCVKARITNIQHTTPLPMSKYLIDAIHDFVEAIATVKLHPVDPQEVYDKQPRPMQQQILKAAELEGDENIKDIVKCFQKKESYGGIKDPRNITTIPGKDKMDHSCFIYALAEHLKKFPWYAFGRSPLELAEHVANICESAEVGVFLGDLSRMDGHISNIGRYITRALMMAMFHPIYHTDIDRIAKTQVNRKGVTDFDVTFFTLLTRLSGSPETSTFNTIEGAFLAYLGYRGTKVNGKYLTHSEAWEKLKECCFGGDDSIASDLTEKAYKKAAKMCGHVATGTFKERGSFGVNFLSRFFSREVWTGRTDSMIDLKRQLMKFHTASHLPNTVSPLAKLLEKSISFVINDPNTPILGPFCTLAVALIPKKTKVIGGDTQYWAKNVDAKSCFPNSDDGSWMGEYVDEVLPMYDQLGFTNWLSTVKTPETLLEVPLFCEPLAFEAPVEPVATSDDSYITPNIPATVEEPSDKKYVPDDVIKITPPPVITQTMCECGRRAYQKHKTCCVLCPKNQTHTTHCDKRQSPTTGEDTTPVLDQKKPVTPPLQVVVLEPIEAKKPEHTPPTAAQDDTKTPIATHTTHQPTETIAAPTNIPSIHQWCQGMAHAIISSNKVDTKTNFNTTAPAKGSLLPKTKPPMKQQAGAPKTEKGKTPQKPNKNKIKGKNPQKPNKNKIKGPTAPQKENKEEKKSKPGTSKGKSHVGKSKSKTVWVVTPNTAPPS